MEIFSALLALLRGIHRSPVNSPHKGQWRGALMFSLICALNKRLSKQSWGWWFETPSHPLWRHCNGEKRSRISSHVSAMWCMILIIFGWFFIYSLQLINFYDYYIPYAITHYFIHFCNGFVEMVVILAYELWHRHQGNSLFPRIIVEFTVFTPH